MKIIHYALFYRGTNEPLPRGINDAPIGMLLDAHVHMKHSFPAHNIEYRAVNVPYEAQYGSPTSYGQSRDNAVAWAVNFMNNVVKNASKDVIIQFSHHGYSQGAVCAGNVARKFSSSKNIKGFYMLADALRPPEAGSMPDGSMTPAERQLNYTGYGVAGSRILPGKQFATRWYSIKNDVITDCYPNSVIRDIADVSEFMGFRSLDDGTRWMADILSKLQTGKWQNLPWYKNIITSITGGKQIDLFKIGTDTFRDVQQGIGYLPPTQIHIQYAAQKLPGYSQSYVQRMGIDAVTDAVKGL